MQFTFKKGIKQSVNSPYFSSTDFDCHCSRPDCTITVVDPTLVDALSDLWKVCGPFKINSGFRCQAHNAECGGQKKSFHLIGKASDIQSLKGYMGNALSRYAETVHSFGSGGIGVATNWIHVDVRGYQARWTYPIAQHLAIEFGDVYDL